MKLGELLEWQWRGYARNHEDRVNLLIHFVAVPLFLAGTLALILSIGFGSPTLAATALASMILSLVLEGIGHKREANPPVPFAGPWDFVRRYFVEQWITFPRFVLSGAWLRTLTSDR
jgi:Protein of unknown function (DUF962)